MWDLIEILSDLETLYFGKLGAAAVQNDNLNWRLAVQLNRLVDFNREADISKFKYLCWQNIYPLNSSIFYLT